METLTKPITQAELQARFLAEIKSKLPHLRKEPSAEVVVNATPLVDLTAQVIECARAEFGLELPRNIRVYGKFDSEVFGGSVKARPAARIIEQAIASGNIQSGRAVFEATSGNFGIALGMLSRLGVNVVALVSRRLQSGVLDQLEKSGVKLVNLDIDICPAPGLQLDAGLLVAKTVATNLRDQLAKLGLDSAPFDASIGEVEQLLARQDVINLAKLLAKIYGGFCPEQYDNEQNVEVHETITAPELDQQLKALGDSLGDFRVVCTFGTGGTSMGIARYLKAKYDRQGVHVVFPLADQEVGGIRTREKALGLKFYRPEAYAGEHDVDFEQAKRVLRFFTSRGYNLGESSALGLYASIQMMNFGVGTKFVVIIADGIQKYTQNLQAAIPEVRRYQVNLEEARSHISDYAEVLWTHTMFAPKPEGFKAIASSLGCDEAFIKVANARDVEGVIAGQQVPETLRKLFPNRKGKILLVCMVGGNSLRVAKVLANEGVEAEILRGGILGIPESNGKDPSELVQLARE